jgi:hypothetical protein
MDKIRTPFRHKPGVKIFLLTLVGESFGHVENE